MGNDPEAKGSCQKEAFDFESSWTLAVGQLVRKSNNAKIENILKKIHFEHVRLRFHRLGMLTVVLRPSQKNIANPGMAVKTFPS